MMVDDEIERTWKQVLWHTLRYYRKMYLQKLRKTTKHLGQNYQVFRSIFETGKF
jgi:hypothetical protein